MSFLKKVQAAELPKINDSIFVNINGNVVLSGKIRRIGLHDFQAEIHLDSKDFEGLQDDLKPNGPHNWILNVKSSS